MPRPQILCRPAAGPDEATLHHRIRHDVFVLEQEVFADSDLDAHDASDATIKVVAWTAAPLTGWEPGGAVRLYPIEPGIWQGDRLAVLAPFRPWLGAPLVRFAAPRWSPMCRPPMCGSSSGWDGAGAGMPRSMSVSPIN